MRHLIFAQIRARRVRGGLCGSSPRGVKGRVSRAPPHPFLGVIGRERITWSHSRAPPCTPTGADPFAPSWPPPGSDWLGQELATERHQEGYKDGIMYPSWRPFLTSSRPWLRKRWGAQSRCGSKALLGHGPKAPPPPPVLVKTRKMATPSGLYNPGSTRVSTNGAEIHQIRRFW